jgi:hypothetical protein
MKLTVTFDCLIYLLDFFVEISNKIINFAKKGLRFLNVDIRSDNFNTHNVLNRKYYHLIVILDGDCVNSAKSIVEVCITSFCVLCSNLFPYRYFIGQEIFL